jgi:hypothetical protein
MWNEFIVQGVQAVIFTPVAYGFTTGKAVSIILPKFRQRFDGNMQVLPLPPQAPPVLPHIILQSADGRWRLQMGPARIDCFWNNDNLMTPTSSLAEIVRECAEVPGFYANESSARLKRVAMVVQRGFPVENPAQRLIERFCSESTQQEPFNRSETFEIHNHKVYTPQSGITYPVNSWVRCKSVITLVDKKPAIGIEQDINTMADDSDPSRSRFSGDISAFFDTAAREADDILRKYFPD